MNYLVAGFARTTSRQNFRLTCSVEPEGNPGDDYDEGGGDVDLDEVVTHGAYEGDLT